MTEDIEQHLLMTDSEADIATLEDICKHLGSFGLAVEAIAKGVES